MTDNLRQLVSEWTLQEQYNHKGDTKRKLYADLAHAKAVIKVAAADTKVTDATRNWAMGYVAAMGRCRSIALSSRSNATHLCLQVHRRKR